MLNYVWYKNRLYLFQKNFVRLHDMVTLECMILICLFLHSVEKNRLHWMGCVLTRHHCFQQSSFRSKLFDHLLLDQPCWVFADLLGCNRHVLLSKTLNQSQTVRLHRKNLQLKKAFKRGWNEPSILTKFIFDVPILWVWI